MKWPSVTVIGIGALGTVLTKGLRENSYRILSLYNRRLRKAEALSKEVDAEYFSEFPERMEELGRMIFITVQDSEIAAVAHQLARLSNNFSGYIFVHCSGNESTDILEPLKQKGGEVGAFHPLQTFTPQSVPSDFKEIYFDVEANHEVSGRLHRVAESLGGHTIDIPAEGKPYLHAAAVFASNYLVTLLETSGKVAALGGIGKNEALKAMLPLIFKTMENVEKADPPRALSGPIKRGDVETVRQHLKLLQREPELYLLYKKLGLQTLEMMSESRIASEMKYRQLYNLLKKDGRNNGQ